MSQLKKLMLPVKDLQTGQVTLIEFTIAGSGGSVESIGDIGDVDLSNPQNGDILVYSAEDGAWVNTQLQVTPKTIGSAAEGIAISVDDITAWSAGTAARASVSGEKVTFTNGTAPSLTYTPKDVPNISVSSTTVVGGVTI